MALPWQITLVAPSGREADASVLLMPPNAIDAQRVSLTLQGTKVDVPSGAGFLDKNGAHPASRYEFEFLCTSRAELAFLRDFFDTHQGRAGGFWFPTWQWELELAPYWTDVGTSALWLIAWGYAAKVFPLGGQYRRMVFVRGNEYDAYRVLSVTADDPAGSGNERVTLTNALTGGDTGTRISIAAPWDYASTAVRPLWLRYGRFDQDAFTVDTTQAGAAGGGLATLAILELPNEAFA